MRNKKQRLLVVLTALLIVSGILLSSCAPGGEQNGAGSLTLGVSVYNTEDAEVQSFRRYFEEYLSPAFDVDFLYSSSILETEEELAFIDQLHERNVPGLISFLSTDLDAVLKRCDEYGMYYLRGSGSISDEAFETASGHGSFLGIIGPDAALECQAGADMAAHFAGGGASDLNILILSGGGGIGNAMHAQRTQGILTKLRDLGVLAPNEDPAALAAGVETAQPAVAFGGKITVLPGYLRGDTLDHLETLLAGNRYDVVLGSLAMNAAIPLIQAAEVRQGRDIRIGMVDSFTQQNYEWFETPDAFGNPTINYVSGKYSATVGPAFAAMYNACTGYAELVRPGGKPFRLVQPFWTAADRESYEELYEKSTNIYDTIYSVQDLMGVLGIYTPEATFADFKELTERDWL